MASARSSWSAADIPDQAGRTVVVTGANSGLGAATARALAAHGARVILACRNVEKGTQAARTMPGDVVVEQLDLADLASVRAFAERTGDLDVLVNNAGVMAVPERRTADGFEMQIGTNFLGHFALTGLLMPRIAHRVVTLSSGAHHLGPNPPRRPQLDEAPLSALACLRAVKTGRPDVRVRVAAPTRARWVPPCSRWPPTRDMRPPNSNRTRSPSRTG